jgi:hypothetical protein
VDDVDGHRLNDGGGRVGGRRRAPRHQQPGMEQATSMADNILNVQGGGRREGVQFWLFSLLVCKNAGPFALAVEDEFGWAQCLAGGIFAFAFGLGMAIWVWVSDTCRVPDPTGMDTGMIFYPWVTPVSDPNQDGYETSIFSHPRVTRRVPDTLLPLQF